MPLPSKRPVVPKPGRSRKVVPGMRFFSDQLQEVVRKHETMPNNWWCRGLQDNLGLWAYHRDTILSNLRPADEKPPVAERYPAGYMQGRGAS